MPYYGQWTDEFFRILDVTSTNSGEVREHITVSADDELELPGSKGNANFIIKFPGENSHSYIKILENQKSCKGITGNNEAYQNVVAFECRGIQITRWHPHCDFDVETNSGTIFHKVDLSDPDGWCEFDDNNGETVSILHLEHRIKKA